MNRLALLIILALLLSYTFGRANAVEVTLHGAVKNETAYFTAGEKRFDKIQNRLDLKPEALLTDRLEFRGRGLLWYDAAMDVESTNATDLTSSIKKHYRTATQLKEAYLLYGGDDFDLRLGQQQIVWGKTEGLRMLDLINPLDMREFMLDDFLDSRIGLVAARLNYYTYLDGNEHEFEFVMIPDARPAELAPTGSRWGFALPTLPAGVTPVIRSGNDPNWAAKNMEYGAAWRSNLGGWDLSLNWFYGWKDTPSIQKRLVGATIFLTPFYERMHTVGGSFSNAFGAWVVRGEMAANLNESLNATGVTIATSTTNKTTLNGAIGVDYTSNNWTVSPQVFVRYISGWDRSVAEDRSSGFASLRISTDFMNEKLKPEVIGLFDWADAGWMVRPKVSYEFSDQIELTAGVDLFGGKAGGFFGQFANNDRIYTEIEYSF